MSPEPLRARCAIAGVLAAALLATAAQAHANPFVYVANQGSDNVSQYDVLAGGLLAPLSPPAVAAGATSHAVAVSPDGSSVYVANQGSDSVSQYDVGSGGALNPKSPPTVAAGDGPGSPAVSPDGASVYVPNLGSNDVSQYDVGSGGALIPKSPPTVASFCPQDPAVSPDGKSVYVANGCNNSVSQYDVGAGGILSPKSPPTVAAGAGPGSPAVSPDGKSVYVASFFDDSVLQYNVGPGGALTPKSPATLGAGDGPRDVAVSRDGNSVYVANSNSGILSQYDVGSGGALTPKSPAAVATGHGPLAVAVGPAECSDTRDNDGDGDADFPADRSCTSATDSDEASFVFGRGSPGVSFSPISKNVKRVSRFFLLYGPATVTTLRAYLDGNGGPAGSQRVRAVIYANANTPSGPGALLAQSVEQSIVAGRPAGFVDFALPTPVSLGVGHYWLGIHSGETHGIARFGWRPRPDSRLYSIDIYADGANNPFGDTTFEDDHEIAIHAIGHLDTISEFQGAVRAP